jgi:hypothetical protein
VIEGGQGAVVDRRCGRVPLNHGQVRRPAPEEDDEVTLSESKVMDTWRAVEQSFEKKF